MSEKTMVTIDNSLVISEGSEKVFENQYIRLEAGIECKGTLIFRNCTIEPCAKLRSKNGRKPVCKPGCISMGIDGKLEIDGCEVIHPDQDFPSSWNIIIKNTSFLITSSSGNGIGIQSVLTPCVIAAHGEAQFDNCSFEEETGDTIPASSRDLLGFSNASLNNCTFKNVTSKIHVGVITGCTFIGCAYIDGTEIKDSTFEDCKSILANNGCIWNCDFIHVSSVDSASSDIDNCRFQKIESDSEYEACVYITDCKITHCSFRDVELRNGSYLIEGVGDSCVEYCQFINLQTSRDDLEICHSEIGTGKLRKRKIEVDILRDDTCTGLNQIARLG